MQDPKAVPSVSVSYAQDGTSTKSNALGMRPMQERAYQKRGEQYLLIKSPPASGKSRALMFIALDKLENQKLKQAIIVVPEKSIGSSFNDEPLSQFGFWADWEVEPKWNLCNAPGGDNGGKVDSVKVFLDSDSKVLVCTHATFRFAVEKFGVESFDDRLIAVDEFHHVSANPDNKLGDHVRQFMTRDKAHLVAMTGSYFRGDAEAVLHPEDESRFDTVTYTYYEQLNGYQYLKQLDIGYYFYSGSYTDEIMQVLNPAEKTIIHIPNVNSRESTKDKIREVDHILEKLGEWQSTDPETGFYLIKAEDGRLLKVADLVDDDPSKRDKVSVALKDPEQKNNRDHVDIIIALGMAKEGFDWIWCEHALTVGYRSSLTEIVQIIGRATRDAPDKTSARFTNLIAEPDATEGVVTEAVNDTLKAIAASLLMEQVLAPRFEFKPKKSNNKPTPGFDYGEEGYDPEDCNVGVNPSTGQIEIEIKGLATPKSSEAQRICREDLTELATAFVQDKTSIERGLFDEELVPEELTQVKMGNIIKQKYPNLDEEDQEAIRQHAIAAINLVQQGKKVLDSDDGEVSKNTSLIDGVKKFALSVTDLDIDLIDRINPFGEAYAILSKTMSEERLRQVAEVIAAKRVSLTLDEARDLAKRAVRFKQEKGRLPSLSAVDPWEKRMAEGVVYLQRKALEEKMPSKQTTDADLELLAELGVDLTPTKAKKLSPKEERIIAGFEEIERFVEEHERLPKHGEDRDIFERLYAVRLDQIRASEECCELLKPLDSRGILDAQSDLILPDEDDLTDEELLASLGVDLNEGNDVTQLKHVRSRREIKAAEEVAQRTPCEDFEQFKPIFEQVQRDLETGQRETVKFQDNAQVKQGDLFILDGQKIMVVNIGEPFTNDYGRQDSRLRVVYDNATESALLLRSLQRALNKDKASRRITDIDLGPLFASEAASDSLETGYIYVLRSQSENPEIAKHRSVIHKIGVTSGDVKSRIANAKKDPTYLLADVEIVRTFQLFQINPKKLEALLHKFFANARLDLELKDRFDIPVKPKEWFLVPLDAIEEAIEKIKDGSIEHFQYDIEKATLVPV